MQRKLAAILALDRRGLFPVSWGTRVDPELAGSFAGAPKRGMNAPKLAIGDGAMGFWAALEEVFPITRQQRCWMHKTMNVLNCLPKTVPTKSPKTRITDGDVQQTVQSGEPQWHHIHQRHPPSDHYQVGHGIGGTHQADGRQSHPASHVNRANGPDAQASHRLVWHAPGGLYDR